MGAWEPVHQTETEEEENRIAARGQLGVLSAEKFLLSLSLSLGFAGSSRRSAYSCESVSSAAAINTCRSRGRTGQTNGNDSAGSRSRCKRTGGRLARRGEELSGPRGKREKRAADSVRGLAAEEEEEEEEEEARSFYSRLAVATTRGGRRERATIARVGALLVKRAYLTAECASTENEGNSYCLVSGSR